MNVPEKAVFDTNIWISGLLWRGKPHQCLLLAEAGIVELAYCESMLDELAGKLKNKFGFSAGDVESAIELARKVGRKVAIRGNLRVISDDPDDDKFLECAQIADARWVVSGDRHLLRLRE